MKRMVSGIKPTGKVTLGNYIGAIKPFVDLQNEYEMYIFLADLHALTLPIDPKVLQENSKEILAVYLASGLDPKKVVLFKQSEVHEHAELGYIMCCNSNMGELSRMTQYKDKVTNIEKESIPTGLFIYPTLMAADILLYNPDYVPVGVDQKQHVELTRDLAIRFNKRNGETFKVCEPVMPKQGAKIMSLANPNKKMSKSESEKGNIELLEDVKITRKKIMSAMTDSEAIVKYDVENKPGISNLLTIMSVITNTPICDLEEKYQGANYGTFKKDVADVVVDLCLDIQDKVKQINDSNIIEHILEEGKDKASLIAKETLSKVYTKIGLK